MTNLLIFVYSYKNKNLQAMIDNIYNTTDGSFSVALVDQNPIDREHIFKSYENMTYRHVYWDYLYGPIQFKQEYTLYQEHKSYAIVSDDVFFCKGWNTQILDFIGDRENVIVSGHSNIKIKQEDLFFMGSEKTPASDFSKTNYIDRNFVFYSHKALQESKFPNYLKYNGEEEYTSIKLYCLGYDIYCAPESLYEDKMVRTIDNLFVPYSRNHGYNKFVNEFKTGNLGIDSVKQQRSIDLFCKIHDIDPNKMHSLPFNDDDIAYDPNTLQIDTNHDVGNRRFLANLKGIF